MRYAVLADVHANLHALQAALRVLEGQRIDAFIVAGDLVGYGPLPDECVDLVAGLGATVVAGNHDLIALERLSDEHCIALARRSLRWTRETMEPRTREYLSALPQRADADHRVVVAHGSLDDPSEYTTRPEQAVSQLSRIAGERTGARVLILGHTHRRWACSETGFVLTPGPDGTLDISQAGAVLINPGAIGQSRERSVRSRFAVLDLDRETVRFHAVDYDTAGCRRALSERGLPPGSYRLRRTALGGARRIAGAARRSLGRG